RRLTLNGRLEKQKQGPSLSNGISVIDRHTPPANVLAGANEQTMCQSKKFGLIPRIYRVEPSGARWLIAVLVRKPWRYYMTEFQGSAAASWAEPWSDVSHYQDSRVLSRPESKWRPSGLLFAAIASLVLWALIFSPIWLFL